MASAFQFGYGKPENFSDWARYAGLDRKTGMMAPSAPTGVAPPETFEDLANQQISNVKTQTTNVGNMFSNVGAQLGQGNVMGAINATRGVPPNPAQPITPVQNTQMAPVNYDFTSRLKNLENQ